MIESYPLHWPMGWPRTANYLRKSPAFKVNMTEALNDLYDELDRLKATNVVVSSSLQVRLDGRPLSNQRNIEDPGVAVYFTLNGTQQCIPCDKWNTVLGNVRAIGLTVQALRGLDRWGAKEMVDAAFSGFKALPESSSAQQWWDILGLVQPVKDMQIIKQAYRMMCHLHHPDKGGDIAMFNKINKAYEEGLKYAGQ